MKIKNANNKKFYSVVNSQLYDYITNEYSKGGITIEEVANRFGLTVGGVKNFMYRHNLNKKGSYKKYKDEVYRLYKTGESILNIADKFNVTQQYITYIINEMEA